jgi:serine protease Do
MDQLEPLIREGMDHARRSFSIERPGRLGITYQELSGQLARYFNVEDGSLLVSNVNVDTPAAKAGLKAGDVIVKLDGKDVSRQDLREQVAKAEGGSQITLGVQRDGKPVDVTVTLPARDRSRTRREPTI